MYLIGYSNDGKGIFFNNPKKKKLIIRRYVIIQESSHWNWDEISTEGKVKSKTLGVKFDPLSS